MTDEQTDDVPEDAVTVQDEPVAEPEETEEETADEPATEEAEG